MNTTRSVKFALIWLLCNCLLTLNHGSACFAEQAPPNVLLISIDDLNDWVGCLGGHPQAKTPNIDRLASRGTLFLNAHCQAPVCQPSRSSLMSSRLPSTTGLYFLNPPLRMSPVLDGIQTLPERFALEGYKVMGAGKVYHGGENKFYFSKAGVYGGNFGGFGPRSKTKIGYPVGHQLWDWGAFPNSDDEMPDTKISSWAIERLAEKHKKPLFLGVGFYRPHVPMLVPQKWFDMHPLESIELPQIQQDDLQDVSTYASDLTRLKHVAPTHEWMVENKQWKHAVQSYLACTSFADHCVGRVLDALDASPYKDNTVIVLFSDHGFHLGEKERWAKRSLWENGTRVPMIIAAHGFKAKQRCARPVGLIDLYPSLLDLCGLSKDPAHEGTSLRPLLENPGLRWDRPALTFFGANNVSVRSTDYRFIRYADGSEELYDLRTDPHEWNNLIDSKSHAKIKAAHAKWVPKMYHPILGQNSTGHKAYAAAKNP